MTYSRMSATTPPNHGVFAASCNPVPGGTAQCYGSGALGFIQVSVGGDAYANCENSSATNITNGYCAWH